MCDVISYWLEYLDTVGATRLLQHRGSKFTNKYAGRYNRHGALSLFCVVLKSCD